MQIKKPKTDAEWQEAVNLARAMRAIADCMMYGLVAGPAINVERCDWLLSEGAKRNITPQGDETELAVALIAAINAEADAKILVNQEGRN